MRQPCPDLTPRQLYVIVYPNERWAFLHAENDYAGRQFSLSVVDDRWSCHVIYMSVLDIVQRQGVVIQLGEFYHFAFNCTDYSLVVVVVVG